MEHGKERQNDGVLM